MTIQASFTWLHVHIEHSMAGANKLIIMCRVNNLTFFPCFFTPFVSFQNNRRGQMILYIVEMHYIRLKVI